MDGCGSLDGCSGLDGSGSVDCCSGVYSWGCWEGWGGVDGYVLWMVERGGGVKAVFHLCFIHSKNVVG